MTLLTGASGGLGRAVASELAQRGHRLALTSRRASAAAELAASVGTGSLALGVDLTKPQEVRAAVDAVRERFGRLDHVLHLAGGSVSMLTGQGNPLLLDTTDEQWQQVLGANLTSAFLLLRATAPLIVSSGGGSVLLVGSGAGHRPADRMAAYGAAKAGLVGLMKAAAHELGASRVRVNLVIPGLTLHTGLNLGRPPQPYLNDINLGELSTVEDFAAFVGHVTTMTHLSGQVLNIDSRVLF